MRPDEKQGQASQRPGGWQEASSGQRVISQHFLGYLAYQQEAEPARPTAVTLFQVSLTHDYPKLTRKELLPSIATELQGSEALTYCDLGPRREANLLGNEFSFSSHPKTKKNS